MKITINLVTLTVDRPTQRKKKCSTKSDTETKPSNSESTYTNQRISIINSILTKVKK